MAGAVAGGGLWVGAGTDNFLSSQAKKISGCQYTRRPIPTGAGSVPFEIQFSTVRFDTQRISAARSLTMGLKSTDNIH